MRTQSRAPGSLRNKAAADHLQKWQDGLQQTREHQMTTQSITPRSLKNKVAAGQPKQRPTDKRAPDDYTKQNPRVIEK